MTNATGGTSTASESTSRNRRSARSAADRQSGPATPAVRATSGDTAQTQFGEVAPESLLGRVLSAPIYTSADSGSTEAAGVERGEIPTSPGSTGSSARPTSASAVHWDTPGDLMELVAQANRLATMLLNGEADIAVARAYADVTKVIASLMRTEIERRRFVGGDPIRIR